MGCSCTTVMTSQELPILVAGLVIRDPIFLTDVVDHEGDGRLVSLFYIVGDYRPGDIDL